MKEITARLFFTFKLKVSQICEKIAYFLYSLAYCRCKHKLWFLYNRHLANIFKKYEINLVLDVGANTGQYGKELRKFYKGEIHSFEPVSAVYKKLKETAEGDKNWKVHNFALGSEESTKIINVTNETLFCSFLNSNEYSKERFQESSETSAKEEVQIRKLSNVISEIVPNLEKVNIFLKLDTQGFDLEAFKGLEDKLKYIKVLQSEIALLHIYENSPHWTKCVNIYEEAGFAIVGMYPINDDELKVIEYDCLMVKT